VTTVTNIPPLPPSGSNARHIPEGYGAELDSRLDDLDPALDLELEIQRLRKERDAIILAHYYQESEIQDLADFVGDSLELARHAAKAKNRVIVFAGVHFMAETAKIVNPDRTVLVPDLRAGCSLADGCPPDEFAQFKASYPDHVVISYINSSAEVKAMSDIICTSSSADAIVKAIPRDRGILFAPDRFLARWVAKASGRTDMIAWQGTCIVHEAFSLKGITELKVEHPGAKVIAHPECDDPVLEMADFVGSTSALIRFTEADPAQAYIVVTEPGVIHQMQKLNPTKTYHMAPGLENCACNMCPHMRLNTLEKLYLTLRDLKPPIEMEEQLRLAAELPLRRLLEFSETGTLPWLE